MLKKYLKEYKFQAGSPLFISRKGNPVSPRLLDKLMKYYAKSAKIPKEKAHWHSLKHSIAVHLAQSTADVKELKNYLGHRNIESTMVYYRFTTAQQEHFYNKIINNSQIV